MATGNHCVHYSGREMIFNDGACKAGIDPVFSYCGNNRTGWIKRAPCFKDNVGAPPCHMQRFPTAEEVAEQNAAFKAYVDDFMKWMPMARERILVIARETNADRGRIVCPKCGKASALAWSRSRMNGHVHARCNTEGCLSWME